MTSLLTRLGLATLAWLLSACDGNESCERFPERCVLKNLRLDSSEVDLTGPLQDIEWTVRSDTPSDWLPAGLEGALTPSGKPISLGRLEGAPSDPVLGTQTLTALLRSQLSPGRYSYALFKEDRQWPSDDPLPTVTVTASPVPVTWKEVAMVPVGGLSSAGLAGSNSKIVAVRGVWLRGSSDYHLLRDYQDNNRALVSEVTATTGASWFTGSVQRTATATNLFFDVWHFGPNGGSLRAVQALKSGATMDETILRHGFSPSLTYLGETTQGMVLPGPVALCVRGMQLAVVMQRATLEAYDWPMMGAPVKSVPAGLPTSLPKLDVLTGFADDANGTAGVGVLGIEKATGSAHVVSLIESGPGFAYDVRRSEAISTLTQGKLTAIAVGDVDCDGLNDLAVGRGQSVQFYFQRPWGWLGGKDSLKLSFTEAGIAIGTCDAVKKTSSLVIADAATECQSNKDATCVHVYERTP